MCIRTLMAHTFAYSHRHDLIVCFHHSACEQQANAIVRLLEILHVMVYIWHPQEQKEIINTCIHEKEVTKKRPQPSFKNITQFSHVRRNPFHNKFWKVWVLEVKSVVEISLTQNADQSPYTYTTSALGVRHCYIYIYSRLGNFRRAITNDFWLSPPQSTYPRSLETFAKEIQSHMNSNNRYYGNR